MYRSKGYSFLAITDHRLYFKKKDDFLLNGCEYNCYLDLDSRYHFHLLTLDKGDSSIIHDDNSYKSLFFTKIEEVQKLIDELKSLGNIVFIAHPKQILIPLSLLSMLKRYDGIEVYNSKVDSDASDYLDALLLERELYCLAVDDSHFLEVNGESLFFRGFIIIEDDLTPLEALKSGRYYSSTGVFIEEITIKDKQLVIETEAEVDVYMYNLDKEKTVFHSKELEIQADTVCIRFVCENKEGKKAWTNLISVK